MNLKKEIIRICENVGAVIEENEDLSDIIEDSLMYVSLIVELEDEFGIEIPTEYLNIDSIGTIDSLVLIVNRLIDINKDIQCL